MIVADRSSVVKWRPVAVIVGGALIPWMGTELRGVAQVVARPLWERKVVGSSPATPTGLGFACFARSFPPRYFAVIFFPHSYPPLVVDLPTLILAHLRVLSHQRKCRALFFG